MNDENTKLNGPDLTQGVELATIPDGTMLLGHALGEPVVPGGQLRHADGGVGMDVGES